MYVPVIRGINRYDLFLIYAFILFSNCIQRAFGTHGAECTCALLIVCLQCHLFIHKVEGHIRKTFFLLHRWNCSMVWHNFRNVIWLRGQVLWTYRTLGYLEQGQHSHFILRFIYFVFTRIKCSAAGIDFKGFQDFDF